MVSNTASRKEMIKTVSLIFIIQMRNKWLSLKNSLTGGNLYHFTGEAYTNLTNSYNKIQEEAIPLQLKFIRSFV